VTGSGFIVLAATLASLGTVPVASITLILGVDRFMSEARALTNVIGNGVATIVIARWENAVDVGRMRRHLARQPEEEADETEKVIIAEALDDYAHDDDSKPANRRSS
jgi:aerobic C4-dicarboxylate transport protein